MNFPERFSERNDYDRMDMVRRESAIIADPLKMAAYRVVDPDTELFGDLQFHMTINNTVIAVMGEQAAKLFVGFYKRTVGEVDAKQTEAEWLPEAIAPLGLHRTYKLGEDKPGWAYLSIHGEERIWTCPYTGRDTMANGGSYAAPTHFLAVKMPALPTE